MPSMPNRRVSSVLKPMVDRDNAVMTGVRAKLVKGELSGVVLRRWEMAHGSVNRKRRRDGVKYQNNITIAI